MSYRCIDIENIVRKGIENDKPFKMCCNFIAAVNATYYQVI